MAGIEPDPMPEGYRVGRYVIEAELPSARMGRVYKAHDTIIGRTVAINVLAPALRTPSGIAKFLACARAGLERQFRGEASGVWVTEPIKDLFDHDGIVGVAIAYVDGVGAAVDVAEG